MKKKKTPFPLFLFILQIFPTFHLAVADVLASFFLIVSSITFFVDTSENGESDPVCSVFSGLIVVSGPSRITIQIHKYNLKKKKKAHFFVPV